MISCTLCKGLCVFIYHCLPIFTLAPLIELICLQIMFCEFSFLYKIFCEVFMQISSIKTVCNYFVN